MSDEGFEKGLKLLLNNAYNKPQPSEAFRAELLLKLRDRQQKMSAIRRHRVIALYSSISAVAAVFVFSVIPYLDPQIKAPSASDQPSIASLTELDDVDHSGYEFATPASYPSENIATSNVVTKPVSINKTELSSLENISNDSIRALNLLDYRFPGSSKWLEATVGTDIQLKPGMVIRTPLGAVDPVSFAVRKGPMVMLDGSSSVKVIDGGLRLNDGRAVISLAKSDKALKLQMQKHNIALQPGSMAFMRMEQGADFAANGAPAPVMVLLRGSAATLDKFDTRLTAGMVYELYDTGTGKYPSREVGSYETQRRFMPMINAIQAANVEY